MFGKKICEDFLNGHCTKGELCRYSHIIPNSKERHTILSNYEDISEESSTIVTENESIEDCLLTLDITPGKKFLCGKFLEGTCTDQHCSLVHGYGDKLVNVSIIGSHSENINNLVKISDKTFLTSDEKKVKIYSVLSKIQCIKTHKVKDKGRISKIFSFDEKIFICKSYYTSTFDQKESIYKTEIIIFSGNDNKSMIEINATVVYDMKFIIKKDILFIFGNNNIDIFSFNRFKKNFDFFTNITISNSVTSAVEYQNFFLCGLENGYFSILEYDTSKKFFEEKYNVRLHDKKINKLLNKSVNDFTHYIITSSDDCSVKISNFEKGMGLTCLKRYHCPVMNIFTCLDCLRNEIFCLIFKDGKMWFLNTDFEILFDIHYRKGNNNNNNGENYRNGIWLWNPFKEGGQKGDFLIINEYNKIECNMWVNNEKLEKNSFSNLSII